MVTPVQLVAVDAPEVQADRRMPARSSMGINESKFFFMRSKFPLILGWVDYT